MGQGEWHPGDPIGFGNDIQITDDFCNICGAKFEEPLHKKDKSKTHYSDGVTVIEFDDED